MSTSQLTLEGVYPILATPFTDRGEVDEESLRELVRFQLQAKVNGIALFGNASEMYTLLDREREVIAAIVTDEVKGRVPLVFGSGHTGLEGAVQLSKWAQKAGGRVDGSTSVHGEARWETHGRILLGCRQSG
ncbi:dihydrodipicolinate synthase family protein [Paenibacillus sp. CC-CFT747]|nr:dihydrodipicolinate synthase family protein [Paenibacillus sp. CC-CFT747]